MFTERLRARAKKDFMTEYWYRYPWPLRIFQIVLFVIFVAIWASLIAHFVSGPGIA